MPPKKSFRLWSISRGVDPKSCLAEKQVNIGPPPYNIRRTLDSIWNVPALRYFHHPPSWDMWWRNPVPTPFEFRNIPGHIAYIGSYYEDKIGTLKNPIPWGNAAGKYIRYISDFLLYQSSFIFIVSRDTPGCWYRGLIGYRFVFGYFEASPHFASTSVHGTAILGGFLGSPRPVSQKFFETRLSPRTRPRTSKWWDFPKTKRSLPGWFCGVNIKTLSLSW